ncbi:hypothetical protein KUCAC02_033082 [Chaenocephalus aceratus]|nr:hypothetical protein KUCAC02_033082 [Chaenocephalus aceratus]
MSWVADNPNGSIDTNTAQPVPSEDTQYAQMLKGSSPVSDWNASDPPHSVEAFLMQVFLTLKLALDAKVLPAYITKWKDVLIGNGAVMIDIVPYLSRHLYEPQCSLFGERLRELVRVSALDSCKARTRLHSAQTDSLALEPGARAAHVLCTAIECLRDAVPSERTTPLLLTLHGNFVTFKDYASDVPAGSRTWARRRTLAREASGGCSWYENPSPSEATRRQNARVAPSCTKLVRNIVLRIRGQAIGIPQGGCHGVGLHSGFDQGGAQQGSALQCAQLR